jgi:hypothetical protein
VGKEDPISFLKYIFPCKFHGIKIEAERRIIIRSLKSKRSCGYDEITSEILKAHASLIGRSLSHIRNHSLYTGVFPDRLIKISIVKPLFKKGDKTSMTNCRPISLLTVFFPKVLEKVMYNRVSHHVHTYNILVSEQFGFRQGKSTDNAAFKLINSVLKSINQKMYIEGIFCDVA